MRRKGPPQRQKVARAAAAQAALVSASFAMLLAGSNAVYPLLPVYRDLLDLDPVLLSATFSLYVLALVGVLVVLANPRFTRYSVVLLIASLSVMIISDLLQARADEMSIIFGRVLGGVAGGFGTGAASALTIAAVGAKFRDITATGNSFGAIIGVVGAQLAIAFLAADAPATIFSGHAAILACLLAATCVVLWLNRKANDEALRAAPAAVVAKDRIGRKSLGPLATGSLVWTSLSVAIVFGPTIFNELQQPIIQGAGAILLLSAVAIVQLAGGWVSRIAPAANGMTIMATGVVAILGAAVFRVEAVELVGIVSFGFGIGLAYRAALLQLTRGSAPAVQGARASMYAAVTYGVAAVVVQLVGVLGTTIGLPLAVAITLGLLGLSAAASLAIQHVMTKRRRASHIQQADSAIPPMPAHARTPLERLPPR